MVQLGPELAPEAGVSMLALASLASLTAFLIARGLVGIAVPLVEALFWPFKKLAGGIPFVGSTLKYPFTKVEQNIIHVLAVAANKLDQLIAHSWHDFSRLVRFLGREIEGLALEIYHHATIISGLVSLPQLVRYAKALLHPIRFVQTIEAKLLRAERFAVAHIRHMVLGNVYPRLRVAEGDLAHAIELDIPRLRARTRAIERRLEREWKWVRSRPWLIASAAMTATVAVCLRRLGLGWLRCRNVSKVGRRLCGFPAGLLDDLLGLAFAFGVLVDPEEIARLALDVEEPIEKLVRKILA
jgi:hypothetical protein